jgi:hypothetical protein
MNIERTWWFKGGVGALTVISATALFYYWGQWPIGQRSICRMVDFLFLSAWASACVCWAIWRSGYYSCTCISRC